MNYFSLLKPFLYALEPETAHHLALWALSKKLVPSPEIHSFPSLATTVCGRDFSNPLGLAAGFDKNAEAIEGLLAQGFGFVEVGTVTPLAQAGNQRPRLFRLEEDEAIINRMGFNNKGLEAFARHMRESRSGIVGSNIGKNKESSDPVADYLTLLKALYGVSDYMTINISSPNTPGLRALQGKEALGELLSEIQAAKTVLSEWHHKKTPIVIKIAPDMSDREMEDIADCAFAYQMDGLIISNTTIGERDKLTSLFKHETGGLSGKPLAALSSGALKKMFRITEGKLPLIGVGGIASGEDAYAKIRAGASLVQIYSTLIYQGFGCVEVIKKRLAELIARDGFASVADIVGIDAKH